MAKRNSTKTATKEAMQSSEPRTVTFQRWNGINIKEVPVGWSKDSDDYSDGVLKNTFLTVQDNVITTSSLTLETRPVEVKVAYVNSGTLTGVTYLDGSDLYIVYNDYSGKPVLYKLDVSDTSQFPINVTSGTLVSTGLVAGDEISDLYVYQDTLIAMAKTNGKWRMLHGKKSDNQVKEQQQIPRPSTKPTIDVIGTMQHAATASEWNKNVSDHSGEKDTTDWHYMSQNGWGARLCFGYCFATDVGTTRVLPSTDWAFVYAELPPHQFDYANYVKIGLTSSTDGAEAWAKGARSVYVYYRQDESTTSLYVGKANLDSQGGWTVSWFGSLQDTSEWATAHLNAPEEDTSDGPHAAHVRMHDSRLYYWGGEKEYRLWIGGNASNELSISRGVGGGWVDIQPGNGTIVNGTAKFKTYQGANIVTIMCGHKNSSKVRRFNLIEDQVTIASDNNVKSWSAEEVTNVVGCQSPWGFGVFADGLYSIDRYGLMVTTQALESNNQLRSMPVGDAIQPVFTDIESIDLTNSQICYIDGVIYMAIGKQDKYVESSMIFCYDTNSKSWYTFTDHSGSFIKRLFNFDSVTQEEGLGYITPSAVYYLPTTGRKQADQDRVFIETGELSARVPPTQTTYIAHLELRLDWMVGDIEIVLDGIDYYGRHIHVTKTYSTNGQLQKYVVIPMRIEYYLESHKLRIRTPSGKKAAFRLTHINERLYTESNKVGMVYGYDARSRYKDLHNKSADIHHSVNDYQDYLNHVNLNVV